MSKPQGLLWIKGNPGVGKSFLMKSAYTTMRRWIAGELVVSFFFNGRGVALQRTPIGLFRALLSSTLAFFPEFLSHLVVLFQEREKIFGSHRQDRWAWSERDLEDFLTKLLTQETKTRPVVIFVDALDECGRDSAKRLLSYFRDLMTDVTQEGGKLRVCFSSRHYPVLGLDVAPTVIVEEQNGKDIRRVIRRQLKEIQPEEERQQLDKEILMKAQGGFQWAVMVASMVTDDYAVGVNTESLRDRIRAIPQALEQLYAEILNGVPDSEKHQTLKLFEWVLFAGRPLVAQELREALVTDKDMACATVSGLRRHRDWTETVEGFERRVKHLSRGLMEFQTREVWEQYEPNGEDFNREAQFIHQSVPDFLQEGGISRIGVYSIAIPLLAGPCHFQLAISCIKYLMLSEVLAETTASRGSISAKFPLAPYAARFFFSHIREADTKGLTCPGLLSLIQWNPQSQSFEDLARVWRILDPDYTHTPNGWPFLRATALHVLVALGSMNAFENYLQEDDVEVDGRDSEGNTPLLLAIREGRCDMAMRLVHEFTKCKSHKDINPDRTPTERGTQQKTRYIDVNVQNDDGDTPLAISLAEKANALTCALIDAGAELKYYGSESAFVFHAIHVQNKPLLMRAIEANIRLDGAVCFALRDLEDNEAVLLDYLSILLKAGASMSKGPEYEDDIRLLGDEDDDDQSNRSAPLFVLEEAIHQVARQGQMSIIELLLSHGASANILNSSHQYPLEIAVDMGHEEAAKVLFRQAPTTVTQEVLEDSIRQEMYALAVPFIQKGVFRSVQPVLGCLCIPVESPPELIDAATQRIISMLSDGYAVHEEHDIVQQPAISAIHFGIDSVVKAIIRCDPACVHDVDERGKTALVYALEKGKEDLALWLATEGQALDAETNDQGQDSLILATMKGYTAVVKAIIHNDPTCVHYIDIEGRTALSYTLENENEEVALLLITEGQASNTGVDSRGRSPLILAVIKGYTAVVKAMLHNDPTCVDCMDVEKRTALIYVLEKEDEEFALFLIIEGQASNTGVDSRGRPPLILATMKGYTTIVEAIFQREGPSTRIIDSHNTTALAYAIFMQHYGIQETFAKWHSNLEHSDVCCTLLRSCEDGETVLIRAIALGNLSLARSIIESGAIHTVLSQDNDGKTALTHFALAGNSEMVRLLLNHKEANSLMKIVDKNGKDALYHAFRAGQLHIMNILEFMGHMDLVHSIGLSEVVAFKCEAAILRMFLQKGAAADFPTRYSIPIRSECRLLENVRKEVAAHVCEIAPIVVATLYDTEQAIDILLATGHISELSYLEALRIAQRFGLETILARLESHTRTWDVPRRCLV